MGIKSPATYGEHYWAAQVEAQSLFDENIETAFASYFGGLFADLPEIAELPAGFQNFVRALAEPPSAGFGGFALGVGVEMIDETLHSLMNPLMRMMARSVNRRALETWLTTEQANTLFRRGKIDKDYWSLISQSEGYDDIIAKQFYTAQLPYPTIPDLVLYSRYHGDPRNIWSTIQEFYDVDAVDFKLWEWLGLQRLTTEQAHTLYRRNIISQPGLFDKLSEIGWSPADQVYIEQLNWLIPNAMLLVQGALQQDKTDTQILDYIKMADIRPDLSQQYLDAILTKPASLDLVNYELRRDPDLSDLPRRLRKIGIHPDYVDVYKTLAYQIPPVADIITMAVREAFTPSIAERFGQYQDFPADFEKYAAMKGLTPEWSKRYWAAHWSLPSATQGFDMLHRGIISNDELNMLLRAQDVMPFWRDKLIQIAYRPLTRVDVRRMYREGVLDEREVYDSYLVAGYAPQNAERMTEFTIKQTLTTLAKFSSTDIVNAFAKRMISRSEAASLLQMLGIRSSDQKFILDTAEYKREWSLTEAKIAAVRNLYKRRTYDTNKAISELNKLNLPADQVEVLMEQWFVEDKAVPVRNWTTAQTLSFMKAGLITKERGVGELRLIGYDSEHIEIYLKDIEVV